MESSRSIGSLKDIFEKSEKDAEQLVAELNIPSMTEDEAAAKMLALATVIPELVKRQLQLEGKFTPKDCLLAYMGLVSVMMNVTVNGLTAEDMAIAEQNSVHNRRMM